GEVFGAYSPAQVAQTLAAADSYIASHTRYAGAYWITADIGTTSMDFANAKACGFAAVAPYYCLPYLFPPTPPPQGPTHVAASSPDQVWPAGVDYATVRPAVRDLHAQGFAQAAAHGMQFVTSVVFDFDSRWLYWVSDQLYFQGQNLTDYW